MEDSATNIYSNPCYKLKTAHGAHCMGDECDEKLYDNYEQVYEKMYDYQRNVSESVEQKQSTTESDVRPAGGVEEKHHVRPNIDGNKKVLCLIFCFIAAANLISVAALGLSLRSAFKNDKSGETLIPFNQQNKIVDIQNQLQEVNDSLLNHKNENLYSVENLTNAVDFLNDVVKNITLLQQDNMNDTQSQLGEVKDRLLDQLQEVNITFADQLGEVKSKLLTLENESIFTFENLTNTLHISQSQFEEAKERLTDRLQEVNITFSDQLRQINNFVFTHVNKSDLDFNNLTNAIGVLQNTIQFLHTLSPPYYFIPECGLGIWKRVAYFNMRNSLQQCPPAWREYTTPVRSCGRPEINTPNCASSVFSTQGTRYARVCGKIIGYQYGVPEHFQSGSLDGHYVDGISVTHGNPRIHVWTFAVGRSDSNTDTYACPCANPSARASPSFVENNYFCESGTTSTPSSRTFYSSDPLWDGEGCVTSQCCTFNSPPWFSVQLPSFTTDDIEVRICGYTDTNNEDIPIELIEMYVQ